MKLVTNEHIFFEFVPFDDNNLIMMVILLRNQDH
jgi:hypothetical protein